MAEYIERELLVKYLEEELEAHGNPDMDSEPIAYGSRLGISYALSLARTLQASDVVNVVRCKDCEYGREEDHNTYSCANFPDGIGGYISGECFCGFGKRKEQK